MEADGDDSARAATPERTCQTIMIRNIPRLAPEFPLPTYAYVRGQHPHPTGNRAGHGFDTRPKWRVGCDPARWEDCHPYLYGIDLFNRGYYWEAHEAWEGLWHACGRTGRTADFFKGLIAFAAAGVKLREGRERGVHQHAARARMLFEQVAGELGSGETHYFGLEPRVLARYASELKSAQAMRGANPESLLPFLLLPQRHGSDVNSQLGD